MHDLPFNINFDSPGKMLQAMESFVKNGAGFSQFKSCFGDEELAVLPRHTKVVVTGNNRTKSVLVGLHGVVKKASGLGLGGWHWLVLANGIEVKLQRNALSVILVTRKMMTLILRVSGGMDQRTWKIDLGKLEMAALWRYRQHFNLVNDIPNPSKNQLIDVVQQHFMTQVIMEFLEAAKRMRNM